MCQVWLFAQTQTRIHVKSLTPVLSALQVQASAVPANSVSHDGVNFKRFRKVQAQLHGAPMIPFANKGYAEHSIDNEAFLMWVFVVSLQACRESTCMQLRNMFSPLQSSKA